MKTHWPGLTKRFLIGLLISGVVGFIAGLLQVGIVIFILIDIVLIVLLSPWVLWNKPLWQRSK